MTEKLQEIIRTLNRSAFVGERYEANMRSMAYQEIIILLLGVVFFWVNVSNGDYVLSLSPLVFIVNSLISYYLLMFRRNRSAAVVLSVTAILLVLTYDALFVPNGFAFLWTLVVPLPVCYFLGVKAGMFITLYFQALFTLAFYTPLRQHLAGHYAEIVMNRFPLLYFFHALLTVFVMYEYHKSVLKEIDYADRLNEEVARQTEMAVQRGDKLERLSEQMVRTLARAIDAKDKYTNGHSFRVMRYSVALAKTLGWDAERIAELRREALLHDIGKIGIPDAVLNKPTRLTDDEFRIVQSHTDIGFEILSSLEGMDGAASVAKSHHERYDGRGYPAGLSGTDIPEHARIVTIADAYDAMHSDRVYRKALPNGVIADEMRQERGRQFDPAFLDAFLELLNSGALE